MSTAEAAELERAVSEDEDFDDDGDGDSEDVDDGTDGRDAHVNQTQATPLVSYPNASAAPVHAPDAIRSVDPAAASLNGAIPIQVVSFTPASSDAPLFTASPSVPIPISSADISKPFTVVTFDESRRLFQRLWTDEEEIKILQGFLEFTSRRGTTFASHQYDTGPFYEEIKKELHFDFTKNQLIEKLRRLKKKYRNCVNRMRSAGKDFAFKSAHEQAIYDIARNIWSAIAKRTQESDDEDLNNPKSTVSNEIFTVPVNEGSFCSDRRMPRSRRRGGGRAPEEAVATVVAPVGGAVAEDTAPVNVMAAPVVSSVATPTPSAIEATVKSCLSPLFKELINSAIGGPFAPGFGGASPLNLLPMNLGGSSLVGSGVPVDDQWRRQQILELEVYLKRIELVTDHVKSMLEELKSSSS